MTLQIWDKQTPITFPNGAYTKEKVLAAFPWSANGDAVMEVDGGVTGGFSLLVNLLKTYNLDESLTGQAALDAILEERSKPVPPPSPADVPATQAEVQALGQQMTDLELLMLEGVTA